MHTKICSIRKLISSPRKTSPYAYKTALIITAVTHNTPVDSLNLHMFCDMQRIATSPQTKRMGRLSLRGNSSGITKYVHFHHSALEFKASLIFANALMLSIFRFSVFINEEVS
jgi:hypothetical protein